MVKASLGECTMKCFAKDQQLSFFLALLHFTYLSYFSLNHHQKIRPCLEFTIHATYLYYVAFEWDNQVSLAWDKERHPGVS